MAKLTDMFENALAAEGVSGQLADLARRIYKQESSSGSNTKTSNAGAVGGMQILPSTFKSVADKGWDIANPLDNARAGIRYMLQMDKQSGGIPELTAAGYYGGPKGLEKARLGIAVSDPRNPKAPNTLQYGAMVTAGLNKAPTAQDIAIAELPIIAPPQTAFQGMAQAPVAVQPEVQVAQIANTPNASQGPDAWQQFLDRGRQKEQVIPADLAYGPMVQNTPDFVASVRAMPMQEQAVFQGNVQPDRSRAMALLRSIGAIG